MFWVCLSTGGLPILGGAILLWPEDEFCTSFHTNSFFLEGIFKDFLMYLPVSQVNEFFQVSKKKKCYIFPKRKCSYTPSSPFLASAGYCLQSSQVLRLWAPKFLCAHEMGSEFTQLQLAGHLGIAFCYLFLEHRLSNLHDPSVGLPVPAFTSWVPLLWRWAAVEMGPSTKEFWRSLCHSWSVKKGEGWANSFSNFKETLPA